MEQAEITKAPSNVQEMPARSDDMRAVMQQYVESATEMAREAAAYADRQVQSNPWTAVGIGFGIGVVFGALVTMAARSQSGLLERLR